MSVSVAMIMSAEVAVPFAGRTVQRVGKRVTHPSGGVARRPCLARWDRTGTNDIAKMYAVAITVAVVDRAQVGIELTGRADRSLLQRITCPGLRVAHFAAVAD